MLAPKPARGRPKVSLGSWAFAFGPYSEQPWSFEEVCEYAATAGYDGVEINGFRPHPHHDDYSLPERAMSLRSLLSTFGLGASGYGPDLRSVPPGWVTAEEYLAHIDKARAMCAAAEIPVIRVDTGMPPQQLPPEEHRSRIGQLIRTWREAAERCSRSGITLVWEFEPGFWLNRPGEIEQVARAVDHPSFGILFDSSHAYTGLVRGARQGPHPELVDSVASYALRLQPFIKHLHLADSDGLLHDEDTSVHTPLGEGKVDFRTVVRALTPILDRLPWWCVDLCYCAEADAKAGPALRYVRRLIDEMEPEPNGVPS